MKITSRAPQIFSIYLQLQINKPRHKEGKGGTKEANTYPLKTRLEKIAAGQGWVDGCVKDGNHDEDENSIGDLTHGGIERKNK